MGPSTQCHSGYVHVPAGQDYSHDKRAPAQSLCPLLLWEFYPLSYVNGYRHRLRNRTLTHCFWDGAL